MNKISNLRKLICTSLIDDDDNGKKKTDDDDENEIWTRLVVDKDQ